VGDLHVHHQAVAVVHQDVAHVAQPRLVALGFLVQARIGIGAAGMGVVAALLAFEVDIGVAPSGRGLVVVVVAVAGLVAVFALEALVRCPSLDQGAVDAEVLVADEPRRCAWVPWVVCGMRIMRDSGPRCVQNERNE